MLRQKVSFRETEILASQQEKWEEEVRGGGKTGFCKKYKMQT